MSASGPNDQALVSTSIYANLSPQDAIARLRKAVNSQINETNKLPACVWLLRESSMKGCLTLSYFNFRSNKYIHVRYGLIRNEEGEIKWKSLTNLSHDEIKEQYVDTKKLVFMNMSTAHDEKNQQHCQSLFGSFEAKGFLANDYLEPSKQEQTRNNLYEYISAAAFIDSKFDQVDSSDENLDEDLLLSAKQVVLKLHELLARTECPISLDEIEDEAGILPSTPVLFDLKMLEEWIKLKGTHPLTREKVNCDDIHITSVLEHARREADKLEKKIEALTNNNNVPSLK